MYGQQGLVGGDHMLAGFNRFEHQLPGNAVATNQFNHNINIRVGDDGPRISHHLDSWPDSGLSARRVQVSDHGNLNAATSPTHDLALVALQYVEHATANSTNTQKAYLDGFDVAFVGVRSICWVHLKVFIKVKVIWRRG